MSTFAAGQRVAASWMGGGWEQATVLEVGSGGAMLRVQFDDGRTTWLAAMNARALPGAPPAPNLATDPNAKSATPESSVASADPGSRPFAPVSAPGAPIATAPTEVQQAFPAPPQVAQIAQPHVAQPQIAQPSQTGEPASPSSPLPPPVFGEFKPVQGAPVESGNNASTTQAGVGAPFNPFERRDK